MVDAGRSIPGHPEVPLHVGVVGKEFAVGIEAEVVRVAVAGTPEFPLLAVGVRADDVASRGQFAGGMTVAIPHPPNEHVFVPVGRQPTGAVGRQRDPPLVGPDAGHRLRFCDILHSEGQGGVIPADDEQAAAVG